MKTRYESDALIPPGFYLQEVLEELGIAQADLARRMGRPAPTINEIINGTKELTADTAIQLEQVLGVPAYFWNAWEADYQLALARKRAEEEDLSADLDLIRTCKFYAQLARRQQVKETSDRKQKVRELRRFLRVTALPNVQLQAIFRKRAVATQAATASILALASWLQIGKNEAKRRGKELFEDKPYDRELLEAALPAIRALTTKPLLKALPQLEGLMYQAGVIFVPVKALTGAHAYGAALWIQSNHPVILVSDLGHYEDTFWFNLFHEIGHLLLHTQRTKQRTFLDFEKSVEPWDSLQVETEANAYAGSKLIPDNEYYGWLQFNREPDEKKIKEFAKIISVHPGIVAGRLCKDEVIHWGEGAQLRAKFEFEEA